MTSTQHDLLVIVFFTLASKDEFPVYILNRVRTFVANRIYDGISPHLFC